MELHILHTNDVHSELDRYARLAAGLNRTRLELQAQGAAVLCFDLGDHLDMSSALTHATGGRVNADLIHALSYDGWLFGNNETLTLEPELWTEVIDRAAVPFYCSNIELPGPSPWLRREGSLLSVGGLCVGVCGVTVRFAKPLSATGGVLADPLPAAVGTAAALRRQGADIVLLLSHLGLHVDQELALAGIEADVIIGAHTHQFLEEPERVARTWICQAGKHALAFGHTVVRMADDGRVADVDTRLVYTDESAAADPVAAAVIRTYAQGAGDWLAEPVAALPAPLPHSVFGESVLVNLLCDRMRADLDADIAMVNGGVVTAALRDGVVRRRDLLAVCSTPMRAVVMNASGERIRQFLEDSLDGELIGAQGIGFGFRGHFIGRVHVSGVTVHTRRETKNEAARERVERIEVDGCPLEPGRSYRIAVCEYIALSHSRFPALRGQEFHYRRPTLRSLLAAALADDEARQRAVLPRYRLAVNE